MDCINREELLKVFGEKRKELDKFKRNHPIDSAVEWQILQLIRDTTSVKDMPTVEQRHGH